MKKSPGEIKFEKHCKAIGSTEKWADLDNQTKLAWERIAAEDDPGDAPPPVGPGQGPGGNS